MVSYVAFFLAFAPLSLDAPQRSMKTVLTLEKWIVEVNHTTVSTSDWANGPAWERMVPISFVATSPSIETRFSMGGTDPNDVPLWRLIGARLRTTKDGKVVLCAVAAADEGGSGYSSELRVFDVEKGKALISGVKSNYQSGNVGAIHVFQNDLGALSAVSLSPLCDGAGLSSPTRYEVIFSDGKIRRLGKTKLFTSKPPALSGCPGVTAGKSCFTFVGNASNWRLIDSYQVK